MQSIIEHGCALGEAMSVSLIVELLKTMYVKTRTRGSVSGDMSNTSSAKKDSTGMN